MEGAIQGREKRGSCTNKDYGVPTMLQCFASPCSKKISSIRVGGARTHWVSI